MYCLENGFKDKTHLPIFVEIKVVKLLFCFHGLENLFLKCLHIFSQDVFVCLIICASLCLMVIFAGRGLKFIVALSQQSLLNASVHFLSFMPIEYTSGMTKTEQNRHAV